MQVYGHSEDVSLFNGTGAVFGLVVSWPTEQQQELMLFQES